MGWDGSRTIRFVRASRNGYNKEGVCLPILSDGYDKNDYGKAQIAVIHPPSGAVEAPSVPARLLLTTRSPEETIALGQRIGQAIRSNLFIALSGDLGAGKTTFTKGLAAGLGLPVTVTSPTFTLVNEYVQGKGPAARRLVHADVYRLEGGGPAELDGIGYGDLLDDLASSSSFGLLVLVVEWADRLGAFLPEERLDVESISDEEAPDVRRFSLRAWGEAATALLQQLED